MNVQATGIMENHQPGKEDQSGKFIILMEIINASVKAGDRLLVYRFFPLSLYMLYRQFYSASGTVRALLVLTLLKSSCLVNQFQAASQKADGRRTKVTSGWMVAHPHKNVTD
jgi:hypothetical protein